MGLLLASRACYDPYHAQYLFHAFAEMKKAAGVEEGDSAFASTRPLDKDRIQAVRKQVRKAEGERAACGCKSIDFGRRQRLDKKLKKLDRESLRRLSCGGRKDGCKMGGRRSSSTDSEDHARPKGTGHSHSH